MHFSTIYILLFLDQLILREKKSFIRLDSDTGFLLVSESFRIQRFRFLGRNGIRFFSGGSELGSGHLNRDPQPWTINICIYRLSEVIIMF